MENGLIYFLVGLALAYTIRHFIRQVTRGESQGCAKCDPQSRKTNRPL